MADRFIIDGATYNGDGTTSAEATSDGGVGAWNTISYIHLGAGSPAYGTLPAGTIVYIRSKNASDVDIAYSFGGTIGASVATSSSQITWVIDSGTVWAGISGVVQITAPTTGFSFTNYNNIICESKYSLILKTGSGASSTVFSMNVATYDGVVFDWSPVTATWSMLKQYTASNLMTYFRNCKFISGRPGYNNGVIGSSYLNKYCSMEFFSCEFDINYTVSGEGLFSLVDVNSSIRVVGGRVYGNGAVSGIMSLIGISDGSFTSVGLVYPATLPFSSRALKANPQTSFGSDGGYSGTYGSSWGFADSRNDGNYPTISAFSPTSTSEPWSWKLYPKFATVINVASIITTKMYVADAATLTLTLQVIFSTEITDINSSNAWIDVSYIDATTSLPQMVSTKTVTGGILDSSTATWSLPTYGAISFNKNKFTVTTPTAVKKDTVITVVFNTSKGSVSSNDIIFICPDFEVV